MEQQRIDELLERYLGLLDKYYKLREELSSLQSGVYQNIARANFAGERGMRYGQDHYDERMQALRVLDIEAGEDGVPVFTVKNSTAAGSTDGEKEGEVEGEGEGGDDGAKVEETEDADPSDEEKPSDSEERKKKKKKKKTSTSRNNPLHWYGLFAPAALRAAQTQSILAVEQVIPRLLSLSAEMANIEIEIRRARKRRTKAVLVAEKETAAAAVVVVGVEVEVVSDGTAQDEEGVVVRAREESVEAA